MRYSSRLFDCVSQFVPRMQKLRRWIGHLSMEAFGRVDTQLEVVGRRYFTVASFRRCLVMTALASCGIGSSAVASPLPARQFTAECSKAGTGADDIQKLASDIALDERHRRLARQLEHLVANYVEATQDALIGQYAAAATDGGKSVGRTAYESAVTQHTKIVTAKTAIETDYQSEKAAFMAAVDPAARPDVRASYLQGVCNAGRDLDHQSRLTYAALVDMMRIDPSAAVIPPAANKPDASATRKAKGLFDDLSERVRTAIKNEAALETQATSDKTSPGTVTDQSLTLLAEATIRHDLATASANTELGLDTFLGLEAYTRKQKARVELLNYAWAEVAYCMSGESNPTPDDATCDPMDPSNNLVKYIGFLADSIASDSDAGIKKAHELHSALAALVAHSKADGQYPLTEGTVISGNSGGSGSQGGSPQVAGNSKETSKSEQADAEKRQATNDAWKERYRESAYLGAAEKYPHPASNMGSTGASLAGDASGSTATVTASWGGINAYGETDVLLTLSTPTSKTGATAFNNLENLSNSTTAKVNLRWSRLTDYKDPSNSGMVYWGTAPMLGYAQHMYYATPDASKQTTQDELWFSNTLYGAYAPSAASHSLVMLSYQYKDQEKDQMSTTHCAATPAMGADFLACNTGSFGAPSRQWTSRTGIEFRHTWQYFAIGPSFAYDNATKVRSTDFPIYFINTAKDSKSTGFVGGIDFNYSTDKHFMAGLFVGSVFDLTVPVP